MVKIFYVDDCRSWRIPYIYSAVGEKLAKKMKDGTYQYSAGNRAYKNNKSLNYLLFDEGLVTKTSSVYSYEYHLKDHLGNTRVTFQSNGSNTTTTQVAEYYPFGSSYLPISPAKDIEEVEFYDFTMVVHEMRHEYDFDIGNMKYDTGENNGENPAEIRAVNNENRVRKTEHIHKRTKYSGKKIDPKKLDNLPND